jgi:L-threonylcarbamoyladenylate synthase
MAINIQNSLQEACNALRDNKVILIPCEMGWALACDAQSPTAVEKMLSILPEDDQEAPTLLVDDDRKLNRYFKDIPEVAWDLLETAMKPLTFVFENSMNIRQELQGDKNSIGIRISKHTYVAGLGKKFGKALAAVELYEVSKDERSKIQDQVDFTHPGEADDFEMDNIDVIGIRPNGQVTVY